MPVRRAQPCPLTGSRSRPILSFIRGRSYVRGRTSPPQPGTKSRTHTKEIDQMFDRTKKTVLTVGGFAALALGGSAIAGAASSSPSTTQSGTTTQSRPAFPAHGGAAHEDAEKPVTGDAATKAKAAAEKSVGTGSSAGAVTTDFGGDGYEVTVAKSDGSKVEVHLDKSFNVIKGHRGRGGPGGFGGPRPGSAAHQDAGKPVTGDAATKAKAAAEKSVGSGSSAGAVTTDFGGDGYEVTVTKSDGSKVEIHLDKSFNLIKGHRGHGGPGGFGGPRPGSAAHEDAEKPVTGDAATKAKAAAEKSVGSGSTAGAVTTDFGGDGYEVTVTKSDGSKVEIHLDKSFNVMQGHGGPGGPGVPPAAG